MVLLYPSSARRSASLLFSFPFDGSQVPFTEWAKRGVVVLLPLVCRMIGAGLCPSIDAGPIARVSRAEASTATANRRLLLQQHVRRSPPVTIIVVGRVAGAGILHPRGRSPSLASPPSSSSFSSFVFFFSVLLLLLLHPPALDHLSGLRRRLLHRHHHPLRRHHLHHLLLRVVSCRGAEGVRQQRYPTKAGSC